MSTSEFEIRPMNVEDETEMRSWYAMYASVRREQNPEVEPASFEGKWQDARNQPAGARKEEYLAVDGAGRVLGFSVPWLPVQDNLSTAWIIVEVAPDARGRGVGSALLAEAERRTPSDRTELLAWATIPPGYDDDHPFVRFAFRRGWERHGRGINRALRLPVDESLLDALDTGERARADGYSIETYVDGVPEEYREELGRLKGLIDVDAPTGDVEFEPSPLSPEDYAEELRRNAGVGRRKVEAVAVRHSPEGPQVVGYSEYHVPSDEGSAVGQEGTLVDAAHRGHGLGMAVKVAGLRALRDLGGAWPAVHTSNEETNRWMVAINEQLGFEVTSVEISLRKRR